jgi:LPS export ABC transporter protein LptC
MGLDASSLEKATHRINGHDFGMKKSYYFTHILSFCCILLSVGCAPKKDALPVSSGLITAPFQVLNHSTLYFYNKQIIQWKLEAEYMRKPLTDTGSILVIPVILTYYDSTGAVKTRVLADSGTTSPSMENFTVWGDVLITTKDSMRVRTQKMWWVKNTRKVESNTYVQIETKKGDILRGKGLDAVEDFSHFSFKSDVSGKFPDFKRRSETNDESFF